MLILLAGWLVAMIGSAAMTGLGAWLGFGHVWPLSERAPAREAGTCQGIYESASSPGSTVYKGFAIARCPL
jgi:hypothetical protein